MLQNPLYAWPHMDRSYHCKRANDSHTQNSTGINRRLLPFFLMMKCIASLSFYYPKASKQMKLAGLLACSILDAFPFRLGTVAFEISRTLSELTAAVSAQDFHLIPFSLITSRCEETSTKIEGKDTYYFKIYKIKSDRNY